MRRNSMKSLLVFLHLVNPRDTLINGATALVVAIVAVIIVVALAQIVQSRRR